MRVEAEVERRSTAPLISGGRSWSLPLLVTQNVLVVPRAASSNGDELYQVFRGARRSPVVPRAASSNGDELYQVFRGALRSPTKELMT